MEGPELEGSRDGGAATGGSEGAEEFPSLLGPEILRLWEKRPFGSRVRNSIENIVTCWLGARANLIPYFPIDPARRASLSASWGGYRGVPELASRPGGSLATVLLSHQFYCFPTKCSGWRDFPRSILYGKGTMFHDRDKTELNIKILSFWYFFFIFLDFFVCLSLPLRPTVPLEQPWWFCIFSISTFFRLSFSLSVSLLYSFSPTLLLSG